PRLMHGGSKVTLLEEAAPPLAHLKNAGVEPEYIRAVEQALGAVAPVSRRLQHGDLWPGNVLQRPNGWALIDFAEFGHAQVPMYDVFHMLQSNPGRSVGPTSQAWLQVGVGAVEDRWTKASRDVVAASARRLGLSDIQVAAT